MLQGRLTGIFAAIAVKIYHSPIEPMKRQDGTSDVETIVLVNQEFDLQWPNPQNVDVKMTRVQKGLLHGLFEM